MRLRRGHEGGQISANAENMDEPARRVRLGGSMPRDLANFTFLGLGQK